MSDDIDRLKKVLEEMRATNDTLKDNRDVMRDVVAAVTPVELETDPEGHGALRSLASDVYSEWQNLAFLTSLTRLELDKLLGKARA